MKYCLPIVAFSLMLVGSLQAQEETSLQLDNQVSQSSIELIPIDDIQAVESFGCDESLDLTFDVIPAGTYQVSETLLAEGSVERGEVILRAGESVTLNDGFEVRNGAKLEVQIGDCIL